MNTVHKWNFISNNYVLFYLWQKENLVKYQKASKYYDQDWMMHLFLGTHIRTFIIHYTSNHSEAVKTSTANFIPNIKTFLMSLPHGNFFKSKGKVESDLVFFLVSFYTRILNATII